ncbi:methyltransferase domain-containing protein [Endozoicomonas sp. 2B-B]
MVHEAGRPTMMCRICDSSNLQAAVDLGEQPWGNDFLKKREIGKEEFYPLVLMFCHDCHAAQLSYTVKKEVMFGDHTYLSGITKSLSSHFQQVASDVDKRFMRGKNNKTVLDIGSNDGTQLKHFKSLGYDVLGVESSKTTANIALDFGIPTINDFFNESTMKNIGEKFDVINAAGVFFHLEELHSVCRAIKNGLKKDGIFVVQFLYMKNILENNAFDQIYHEHLLYYTFETIQFLLERHNLQMFDAYLSPIHGGSAICFVSHKGVFPTSQRFLDLCKSEAISNCNQFEAYEKFSHDIKVMKQQNLNYLQSAKSDSKTVYGFGAPVKGNTLLNYFGINRELVKALIEKNELRRGLYSPGMHIPILIESDLNSYPDIYYVLAWNFKDEILKNNQHLIEKGVEFYFPVEIK